eukprot:6200197-Pleurochrysis_carterae.AAC.4
MLNAMEQRLLKTSRAHMKPSRKQAKSSNQLLKPFVLLCQSTLPQSCSPKASSSTYEACKLLRNELRPRSSKGTDSWLHCQRRGHPRHAVGRASAYTVQRLQRSPRESGDWELVAKCGVVAGAKGW